MSARPGDESGFSIIETTIALGLVVTVLMGLLASLNTGVRGVLTGRQRSGAIAVAKDIVEEVRSARYEDIGHDLSGDSTLSSDAELTGTPPAYEYQPEGVAAPEPLVGVAAPWRPEHEFPDELDSTDYTIRFYVTTVEQAVGKDHKRLTVAVSWDNAQYPTSAVANELVVSTFVSPFGVSSAADVSGAADVDSGSVSVTGNISGVSLTKGDIIFPYAHADSDAALVTQTRGFSGSARSSLEVSTGTASGCGSTGAEVTCSGTKLETEADNDGWTPICIQESDGPTGDPGGTLSAGSVFDVKLGSTSSLTSKSSAQAGNSCSVSVGDGDGLLYGANDAPGPSSAAIGFVASILGGNLVDIDSAGSASVSLDADPVLGNQKIVAQGSLTAPEVDLVTLSSAPLGYTSAVNITGFDATLSAEAGPTAVDDPQVLADEITVTYYDTGTLGLPEYKTVSFTPGEPKSRTGSVTFDVSVLLDVVTVTLDTTITAGSATTSSSGTPIDEASGELTNWFVVSTRIQVVELGSTIADLTVELDYGRIAATVDYTAP